MPRSLIPVDDGVWTLSDALSTDECRLLIDRAAAIGFEAASVRTAQGAQMRTDIRNNDRVVLRDPELARLMWERVADVLPPIEGEVAVGVDSELRFYRYEPGQQFKRHRDGSVKDAAGRSSRLSYLIYLNDGCRGGETTFYHYGTSGEERVLREVSVSPSIGTALVFRHERWHAGSPVTEGRKYVLRSDVFYGVR